MGSLTTRTALGIVNQMNLFIHYTFPSSCPWCSIKHHFGNAKWYSLPLRHYRGPLISRLVHNQLTIGCPIYMPCNIFAGTPFTLSYIFPLEYRPLISHPRRLARAPARPLPIPVLRLAHRLLLLTLWMRLGFQRYVTLWTEVARTPTG